MTAVETNTSNLKNLEDLFDLFAVDKKRATGGVPFTLGGTTFQIARANNPRHAAFMQAAYAILYEQFKTPESRETPEFEEALEAKIKEGIKKHVILGWDAIKLQGKVYEGPSDEGYAILLQLDELVDILLSFANNRKNYAPVVLEEDAKN